jgi:hypothetical protein
MHRRVAGFLPADTGDATNPGHAYSPSDAWEGRRLTARQASSPSDTGEGRRLTARQASSPSDTGEGRRLTALTTAFFPNLCFSRSTVR